jgi:transcriptional regulator with XRE-family HTH domain
MSFGKRVVEVRNQQNISQTELADLIKKKSPVLGRYEREQTTPGLDVANRIANVLNVSLDYLVGNIQTEFRQDILDRMDEINKMPKDERDKIISVIDALIRDYKVRAMK